MKMNPDQLPVIGVETEITCLVTLPGDYQCERVGTCHGENRYDDTIADTPTKSAFEDLINNEQVVTSLKNIGLGSTENGMLTNGGRMYVDPSGLEYATPEVLTAEEAVHRVFDGDRITYLFMRDLQERGVIKSFQLNRRAVDHNGTARGVHTNLTVGESFGIKPLGSQALVSLAVAKGAMFGSGGLLVDKRGNTAFHHSPRLSVTDCISSLDSYTSKPLVRTGMYEDTNCQRMHFVTDDALNFAWPMRASIVINKALVQLAHVGLDWQVPELTLPLRSAATVGRYGMGRRVEIIDKFGMVKNINPLEILVNVAETALAANNDILELDKETTQVLGEVIDIADMMRHDKFSVAGHIESVARLGAMQSRMEKLKTGIGSAALCTFDYYWDMIGGGLAQTLRELKKQSWLGFDKPFSLHDRDKRLLEAPKNTRAKLRAEVIKLNKINTFVDWDKVAIGDYTDYLGTTQTKFEDGSIVKLLLKY